MKKLHSFPLLAAIAFLMAACQSNAYHIKGTAEGLEDGDTLFITFDFADAIPSDTVVVKDGKFSLDGEADSVQLAMIYSLGHQGVGANFYIEPGDITITLSNQPDMSHVGGTNCNDLLQETMDSVAVIGKEMNRIAEKIMSESLSEEEEAKCKAEIDKLNQRYSTLILKSIEQNIKNEFGYSLLTTFSEGVVSDPDRKRLINMLPDNMRQRPGVKAIEKTIEDAAKTAVGQTLPDFSQPAPDGTVVNIKDQYSQHQVTIIDFWASWCGPCREEMPSLVALYNDYKDKGLGVVGVSLDNDATAWQTAISKLNMTWPQMSDLKGWKNAAAQQLKIESIPHTIIVDQKGTILQRGLRGDNLRAFIEEQLKK